MASTTQVIITTVDDIDGTPGAKTIKFGLDDKVYSIDLNPAHEATLREFLALYIGHAKPAVPAKPTRKTTRSTSRSIEIREWARSQGMTIPERGRISQNIIEAYNAAHSTPATLVPAQPEPVPAALSV